MNAIVWQDPPPRVIGKAGPGRVGQLVEALKTRPGQWALDPEPAKYPSATTSRAKRYPGTEWTQRKRTDGRIDIYGRWIGGES